MNANEVIANRALELMGWTSLNVTGDMAVICIVAKSEKQLDGAVWDSIPFFTNEPSYSVAAKEM